MSPEFQENIEQYFVENIKVSLILHMYFLTSTLFFLKRLCFKIHKPFLGPSLSFVLCMNEWEKENIKTKERKKNSFPALICSDRVLETMLASGPGAPLLFGGVKTNGHELSGGD